MFTFGRDHEKQCATRSVRDPAQVAIILALIDAIHDHLEGKATREDVRSSLRTAFIEGGSGVWEQAGSWLRKLGEEDREFHGFWLDLASHPRAEVRFRAAACLGDMPTPIAERVYRKLAEDRSRKVREMAADRRRGGDIVLGKLIDVIDQLDMLDDSDRFNPMVLYAEKGPNAAPSARAAICASDDEKEPGVCPLDASLSYVLEVKPAREAIRVWSVWRDGRTPSPTDRFEAVMHYARHDAFLPLE